MSEAPRMDGSSDADASAIPDPAAANTAGSQGEVDPQVAGITKELSVDLLARMGLAVSGASGSADITYEKETPQGGGSFTERTTFTVSPNEAGDANSIVSVHWRSDYRHPNGGRPIHETQQVLRASVDTNASTESGGIVGDIKGQIIPNLDKYARLYDRLGHLQQHPGYVTVTFRPR